MMNFKKLMAAVLALAMVLCLGACGSSGETETTAATVEETEAPVETTEATEATEALVDDGSVTYTITIVDEGGNPVPGAIVQMCKDTCFPGVANEEGIVTFSLPEDTYKVSFLTMPAGYDYADETQEFYFAEGSCEMTIVLKAVA